MCKKINLKDLALEWKDIPLGKVPDSEISRKTNLARRIICRIRNRLKIPRFKGLILTQEGLPCRSIYESMFDCYLHWKKIKHEHEVRAAGLPYIADFKIAGKLFEIFGMSGFYKYDKRKNKKIKAYKENGIRFRSIPIKTIEKLYNICPVKTVYNVSRKCSICGKETYRIIKNICHKCYMNAYHKKPITESRCITCNKKINSDSIKKYCSHSCYWESLKSKGFPSDEQLLEMSKKYSLRKIAKILGTPRETTRKKINELKGYT